MRIQNVNLNKYNFSGILTRKKPTQNDYETQKINLPAIRQPMELALLTQKEDEFFESFLNKKGKVDKQEYDDIIKKHPRVLLRAIKRCEEISITRCASPKTTAKIAYELKRYYDEVYKNYTIVSVGTSPAPITEVMQNLGAKVIFLPISGLRELEQNSHYFNRVNYPTLASKHWNLELIMDYCTKKGIAKNKNDKILILDLCASGKSARIIKQLFEERRDIPKENIFIHDVTGVLKYIRDNSDSSLTKDDINNFDCDMRMSRCAKISNVAHFYYDNSGTNSKDTIVYKPYESKWALFKRFDNFSKPQARAWALVATHEAFKLQNNIS